MREDVPGCGRRTGADPVAAGPCFGADHRTVPWHEAGSGSRTERRDQVEGDGVALDTYCNMSFNPSSRSAVLVSSTDSLDTPPSGATSTPTVTRTPLLVANPHSPFLQTFT